MTSTRSGFLSAVLLAATLGGGCTDEEPGLGEDTYVEVMARLTRSRARNLGTHADDSTRAAVLEESGVTGQDLLDFAERYGSDVTLMEELWDQIRTRVDSLEQAVSTDGGEGMLRMDSLGREPRTP